MKTDYRAMTTKELLAILKACTSADKTYRLVRAELERRGYD